MASTATATEDPPIALDADASVARSCLNDPNYAIVCVFLQKFGAQLKVEHPDFLRLQQMLENTDEGKASSFVGYAAFSLLLQLFLFRSFYTFFCFWLFCFFLFFLSEYLFAARELYYRRDCHY